MTPTVVLPVIIGGLYAAGVYLLLDRSLTRVLLGFLLLGNATNLLLLSTGGPAGLAPILGYSEPEFGSDLAHLRNLYVARSQWGSGLATALLRTAERDARDRGFTALRLFVAEGQARARRFYEREGWRPQGEPFFDAVPGLSMVEYRRPIG